MKREVINLKRSILSLGTIFLFIISIINPVSFGYNVKISIVNNNGNTLYVGGNGTGNYTSIQDAIDDAIDGDTVFVYNGTYKEAVDVDKSINLIGEDRDITKINNYCEDCYAIDISTDFVNISGFTIISYCFNMRYEWGCILIDSCNNNLSNNIIKGEWVGDIFAGIELSSSSNNNTIIGNIIIDNDWGIYISSSNNNIIKNNNFSNNWISIEAYNSNNNIIMDNYILKNTHGIELSDHCSNNILSGNTLIDITCCTCIGIRSSNNNLLIGNTIKHYSGWGTGICLYHSENNIVIGNLISRCGDGIGFANSSSNIIQCNNIMKCYSYGIESYDNALLDSNYFGLHLKDCIWNNINDNEISIKNYVLHKFEGCQYDNIFHHNNLKFNVKNAYDECINHWDNDYPSGGNYWSDYSGEDNDGDGLGDTPYFIPGGENEDRYPLIEPWEDNLLPIAKFDWTPLHPDLDEEILFNASDSIDYDGYISQYEWDWDNDGIYDQSYSSPTANYTFGEMGYHAVTLLIQDNGSEYDTITKTIRVGNQPPNTPIINGPDRGIPGVEYTFCINATDPDNDTLFVIWNWGDGSSSEWLGPYVSGSEVCDSHIWNETGVYTISVSVIDEYGENVTAYKEMKMPRDKSTSNYLLFRFLARYPLIYR